MTYQSFADPDALSAAYAAALDFMEVEEDTRACSEKWPAEGSYTIGDEPAGRVGCTRWGSDGAIIAWTSGS